MRIVLATILLLVLQSSMAQVPDAGLLVNIHSATLLEINAIVDPIEGSLIYNTDDKFLYQYTGSSWDRLTPYKSTFTDNGDGTFTFSNGVDPDVNFTPNLPGNVPIVTVSDATIGNCDAFDINTTKDIKIQGEYFDGSSTVSIIGQTVNSVVINSSTQITANVTSGGTYGSYDISVSSNVGTGTLANGFTLQSTNTIVTYPITIAEMTLSGTMTYDGTNLVKTANGGWNSQGYSLTHEIPTNGGGYIEWTVDHADKYLMHGLSSNPTSSASYTNLDYAIYMIANGAIQIRENGVSLGSVDNYVAGDMFRINVDCLGQVTYYKNGSLIFSSTKQAFNPLYFDSSYYTIDSSTSDISISY